MADKKEISQEAKKVTAEAIAEATSTKEVTLAAPELHMNFFYGTEGGGGHFILVDDVENLSKLWKQVPKKLEERFALDALPITTKDLEVLRDEISKAPLNVAISLRYKGYVEEFSTYLEKDEIKKTSKKIQEQTESFMKYVDAKKERNWVLPR